MIEVKLLSPKGIVFDDKVEMAIIPGREGYFEVNEGHAPLLTTVAPGVLEVYYNAKKMLHFALHNGIVEISDNRISILSEMAETPESIDKERAENAKTRAEKRLSLLSDPDIDLYRAKRALMRAEARLAAHAKLKQK